MRINFKQPKYVLPLILLPFLCLFFFVFHSGAAKKQVKTKQVAGLNGTVGQVAPDIQKKQLEDKLDAYRNTYKESDGMTAVTALPTEKSSDPTFDNHYNDKEKRMLDSINRAMKNRFPNSQAKHPKPGHIYSPQDQAVAEALQGLSTRQRSQQANSGIPPPPAKDPMELFKQQMAYIDSVNKANDPAVKAERQKKEALAKAAAEHKDGPVLAVSKAAGTSVNFNTVMPQKLDDFIKVVIDENITGYAGSRIRLRLLDDINVGRYLVPKDTYLYSLITGFSGQRVVLTVKSILFNGKLLPVKLEVYDLDGLEGLYVPESAFRDFTKDLGNNTVQGVTLQNDRTGTMAQQLAMSTVSKFFESTSTAIAGIIRKDKAKIKYNSYLYLIDNEALQKAQNNP
ncbi:MAG: conjugative transposon protein TraM [Bacteroidetes bacterium]|nr:conjugative transposon protein TraM [Bacteroidota bacterium]